MRCNKGEVSEMSACLMHACQEILQNRLVQARQFCRIRCQFCQPLERVIGIGPFRVRATIAIEFCFDQESIDGQIVQSHLSGRQYASSKRAIIP